MKWKLITGNRFRQVEEPNNQIVVVQEPANSSPVGGSGQTSPNASNDGLKVVELAAENRAREVAREESRQIAGSVASAELDRRMAQLQSSEDLRRQLQSLTAQIAAAGNTSGMEERIDRLQARQEALIALLTEEATGAPTPAATQPEPTPDPTPAHQQQETGAVGKRRSLFSLLS